MGIVSRLIREFRGPVSKLTVKVRMPGMRRLRRHLKTVDGLATSAAGSVAALNDELESLGERLTVKAISGEELELIARETRLMGEDTETPRFPDEDQKHLHRATVLVSPGDDWIEIAGINCEGTPTVTLLTCTETLGGARLPLKCFVCNVDDVLTIGQRKPGEGVAFKRSQEAPEDGRVIAAALAGLSDEELLAKRGSLIPKVKVQVPMPPVKPPRLSDEERVGMFSLVRHEDETGVSGTGVVAQGARFASGKCAMCWLTDTSSVAVYDSMDDLVKIHGHKGKTEVMWHD